MEPTGQINISIKGKKGNIDLKPENYDIRELIEFLKQVEHLLFSNKKDRSITSYHVEEGSVRHVITTSMQAVVAFNAILAQIKSENNFINFLEPTTAGAFESFQKEAEKNDYTYLISTSISEETALTINKETRFIRSEDVWVDAEFYFYGEIVDAGGKGSANVHLDTKDYGLLKISAAKSLLAAYEGNPLYKPYGVRAKGKQNVRSGELDKNSLELIDIIDYNPSYKEDYIKGLIKKAKKSWEDVPDADEWLQNIRGYGS
ncbi:MAG: hypothetical protein J0M29_08240 [Chitinophagales bacterium]|nr:hypothetical protein [Chitinophagales bacterium]